jgi:2,4-dienoyl-CoA reductase (NADPH2)
VVNKADREVWLMQRKDTPVGRGLGKTTGWTKRILLNRRGVNMVNAVDYVRIDDSGLHVLIGGQPKTFEVDTVIICAGQLPERGLYDDLMTKGVSADLIGGAFEAVELDAKTAINQATYLAAAV